MPRVLPRELRWDRAGALGFEAPAFLSGASVNMESNAADGRRLNPRSRGRGRQEDADKSVAWLVRVLVSSSLAKE